MWFLRAFLGLTQAGIRLKLLRKLISAVAQSLPFGIGMAAYYLGARAERRRQHQQRK
jgi:hypothetical protein